MFQIRLSGISKFLLSATLAAVVWYGVYRLTTPQPHYSCIADLIEEVWTARHTSPTGTRHFRFDSTGWWFAVGPSKNNIGPPKHQWTVHHLKTGQLRELEWEDCLDPESWVPLEQGYRHTRQTIEGNIEIVDTSFVDGTSVVRRSFAKGSVADRRVFFSRDGRVAVITQRLPLVKLLALGSAPGMNCAESLLWMQENPPLPPGYVDGLSTTFDDEQATGTVHEACPRLARFWDIDSGELTRTFLLPVFTTSDSLLLSPDGKQLVRLEPRIRTQTYRTLFPLGLTLLPLGFHFYDRVSGEVKHTKPTSHEMSLYNMGCINDVGIASWDISLLSGRAFTSGLALLKKHDHPFFTFPISEHITTSNVLHSSHYEMAMPVRTADGIDVALIEHQNKVAIAKVGFESQAVKVLSKPIEIPQGENVALIPISVLGQVMVTWSPEVTNQEWYDLAAKWNLELGKYLSKRMKSCAAIVDVQSGAMIWKSSIQLPERYHDLTFDSNISCRPLQWGNIPGFTTTWNRQAIVASYAVGKDLHLYRWELPLVSWSPEWSIGAGVLVFVVMLWLLRKRSPKQITVAAC